MSDPAEPTGQRIQKVLSRAGVASRREAERLIRAGRVRVNGEVVTELGSRVNEGDELRVDDQLVDPEPDLRYVVMNKPPGTLCTMSDPEGRPTVVELLPEAWGRLYPVGRLDWASEGLLLLTNDGALANRLLHPRYEVERVYEVKVRGRLSGTDPKLTQMRRGVPIGSGQVGRIKRVESMGSTGKNTWLRLVLAEGKNREVRRICEALELTPLRLKRVAYGPLTLTDLKPGEFRELSAHEAHQLTATAAGKAPVKRPPAKAKAKSRGKPKAKTRRSGSKPRRDPRRKP